MKDSMRMIGLPIPGETWISNDDNSYCKIIYITEVDGEIFIVFEILGLSIYSHSVEYFIQNYRQEATYGERY